jgi:hypothetical protein
MARKWRALEILSASLERALAPQHAVVKSPDHLPDLQSKVGRTREVDVSIRVKVGSLHLLITVECRARGRREGPDWIEQLAKKKEALGADATIAVSTGGFTAGAKEKAALCRIDLRQVTDIADADVSQWFRNLCVTVKYAAYKLVGVEISWAPGHEVAEREVEIELDDAWSSPVFVDKSKGTVVSVGDVLAEWWEERAPGCVPGDEPVTVTVPIAVAPGSLYLRGRVKDFAIKELAVKIEVRKQEQSVSLGELFQYSGSEGIVAYAGRGTLTTGLDKPLDFIVHFGGKLDDMGLITRDEDGIVRVPLRPKRRVTKDEGPSEK